MKRALFLFLGSLLALGSFAGEPLTFTEVVQVEGASKDELFNRAQAWFATAFKCGKCSVQTQDKEGGQIIGNGAFQYESATFMASAPINGWVRYVVKIFVKDGRYKYEISSFVHEGSSSNQAANVHTGAMPYSGVNFGLVTTDEEAPECAKTMQTSKGIRAKNWAKLKTEAEREAKSLVATMTEAMKRPASGSQDW